MTERVMRATAASYVISPAALGALAPDPGRAPDRLSARWLIALAARTVREVGDLLAGATATGRRVATFAADGEVRFASAADRAAFAEELAAAVTALVSRYHDGSAPGGGCGVSAYHYFYGEPVDVETLTKAWDSWLGELFPPVTAAG